MADAPVIDSVGGSVQKLIEHGKERGYVTYDELNAVLPQDDTTSEQIEDTMAQLSQLGVNVIDNEDADDLSEETKKVEETTTAANDDDLGRTDDPVRMYLREMGSVELLSREGEIAIAKRIEAGREKMISAICDSPLTLEAMLSWREGLLTEELHLRDFVDLEAAYGNSVSPRLNGGTPGKMVEEVPGIGGEGADEVNLSQAAMEKTLLPQITETLDELAATYQQVVKLRAKRDAAAGGKGSFGKISREKLEKFSAEMLDLVKSVRINNPAHRASDAGTLYL